MSNEITDSVKITAEERKALMASIEGIDNEDAETVPAAAQETGQEGKGATSTADADDAGKPGKDVDGADPDAAADPSKPVMIPKARFDEAVGIERQKAEDLRKRLDAIELRQAAADAVPESTRDYAAEKKALREQYDNGDIDAEKYEADRDAIVVEEATFNARLAIASSAAKTQNDNITADWNKKIGDWVENNADFLADPLNREDFNRYLEAVQANEPNLDNDALIEKVQELAFRRANWTPKDPHADRNRRDASAAAVGSSLPDPITGGQGNRASEGKGGGIENVKPGSFSSTYSKAEADELLGLR